MNARFLTKFTVFFSSLSVFSATTNLGDAPPFGSVKVPPNMMLALSVEFPTGDLAGYKGIPDALAGYTCGGLDSNSNAICYFDSTTGGDSREYIGIFDPRKCYDYDGDKNSTINGYINYQPYLNSSSARAISSSKVTPGYFYPVSLVTGLSASGAATGKNYTDTVITTGHACNGQTNTGNASAGIPNTGHALWSGNYLNWVAMHAIDSFRTTLTGGDRVVDTTGTATTPAISILEKARHDGQGGYADFPVHLIQTTAVTTTGTPPGASTSVTKTVPAIDPSWYTPYPEGTDQLYARVMNGGQLVPPFSSTDANGNSVTVQDAYTLSDGTPIDASEVTDNSAVSAGRVVQFAVDSGFSTYVRSYMVRAKVCDYALSISTTNPVPMEPNCQLYNNSYKPTGLIQTNINNIRVGAAGYLLDNTATSVRPGGVIRARIHDLGTTTIVPNGTGVANPNMEVNGDGVFVTNPDTADATASSTASGITISQSGSINYLNKFGKAHGYKTYDTLGEMYYEALRYIHLSPTDDTTAGGVRQSTPEYTSSPSGDAMTSAMYDNFPVITNWATDDPIEWYCQKNVIVGIADTNTWCDSAVPGYLSSSTYGQMCPTSVASNAVAHPNLNAGRDTLIYSTGSSGTTNNLLTAFKAMDAVESTSYAGGANLTFTGSSGSYPSYEFKTNGAGTTFHSFVAPALAYWANTQNIRPSYPNLPADTKITAQTYWLDVMEAGVSTNGPTYYNWAWLAAKYGGFVDDGHQVSFSMNGSTVTYPAPDSASSWQNPGTNLPNNYFQANRPDYMKAGLQQIFSSIAGTVQSGAGATLGSAQITTTGINSAFVSEYNPNGWYAQEFLGETLTANTLTGNPSTSQVWDASANLDTQAALSTGTQYANDTDTARRIITMGATGVGVPFRYSNLTSAQQTAIGSNQILHYLRGDRSYEIGQNVPAANQIYRQRTHLLGDIVDSQAAVVNAPNANLTDNGYSAFVTAQANREPVVYVGSNDGMLHAFDGNVSGQFSNGSTNSFGGQELWAYIPSFVISVPNPVVDTTPSNYGIGYLSSPQYSHRYYVDQTPQTVDIDFCNTVSGKALTTAPCSTSAGGPGYDWHTILVSGLNKGGMGYFALDITNPVTFNSGKTAITDTETTEATRVLWEFGNATLSGYSGVSATHTATATDTGNDIGYTYGYPVIVKTTQYGWVVLVTSGYNNVSGTHAGQGFLYVLDPRTGALITKLGTGTGTLTNPSGMAKGRAFIPVATNYIADYAYYGDLLGNVWRFDLTPTSGGFSSPLLFARTLDPSGNPQPITGRMQPDVDTDGIERYVFVGTGQLFAASDEANTQQQSFYAFRDGTLNSPFTATNLPPSGSFPVTRSNLTAVTTTTLTTEGGAGSSILTTGQGWYYDLPGTSGSPVASTERIVEDITSHYGLVTFASITPANPTTNVCSPNGTGGGYTLAFANAQSAIMSGTSLTASFVSSSSILNPQFVNVGGQAVREYYTNSGTGAVGDIPGAFNTAPAPSRVFWKEIFQ